MSCPYCGRTDDCPHWEPRYNCWSRDGKGSYAKSVICRINHPWLSSAYNPNLEKEEADFYVLSGSSSALEDCIVIKKTRI